ncbi:MAG: Crp/Fnr family transcriptional regulator [Pseudanabaenaceae cyanobacterium bins.68]|nr:Crp/Fnr family transcriptional regulator [Pseudanabaenaceae cyanobacterium bins.68]
MEPVITPEWNPAWRELLEGIYQGRNLYTFLSGQTVPLYPHVVWVVCRGVALLSSCHSNGDEVVVGLAVQSMPFGSLFSLLQPYQAIALCDLDLMRLTIAEIEQSPQLNLELCRHLRRRLQQTEKMLALANHRRVEERLKQLLLMLQQDIGQSIPEGIRLTVRLTHQQLASAIGSTRVTVTKTMGQLEEEGWLITGRDRHIILRG